MDSAMALATARGMNSMPAFMADSPQARVSSGKSVVPNKVTP